MKIGEYNDWMLMKLLPATSPEMSIKISGADRGSREYQAVFNYVSRRMRALEKSKYVRWEGVRDGARIWMVRA